MLGWLLDCLWMEEVERLAGASLCTMRTHMKVRVEVLRGGVHMSSQPESGRLLCGEGFSIPMRRSGSSRQRESRKDENKGTGSKR